MSKLHVLFITIDIKKLLLTFFTLMFITRIIYVVYDYMNRLLNNKLTNKILDIIFIKIV